VKVSILRIMFRPLLVKGRGSHSDDSTGDLEG
jgi:hypothetical protein